MEKINEYQKQLTEMVAVIDGENLTALNFDRLKQMLTEIGLLLEASKQSHTELELLRQDFTSRISGMEKAMAIANRGNGKLQGALELIDNLGAMTAPELIRQYTRTQARFKDAFPASFGFLHRKQPARQGRSLDDYK